MTGIDVRPSKWISRLLYKITQDKSWGSADLCAAPCYHLSVSWVTLKFRVVYKFQSHSYKTYTKLKQRAFYRLTRLRGKRGKMDSSNLYILFAGAQKNEANFSDRKNNFFGGVKKKMRENESQACVNWKHCYIFTPILSQFYARLDYDEDQEHC